ncbi:MAG: hypothetical protein FI734_01980 [SAR202 cluster bacterium]|nr:hypothetical protein [SAR202 cluster bacterium]
MDSTEEGAGVGVAVGTGVGVAVGIGLLTGVEADFASLEAADSDVLSPPVSGDDEHATINAKAMIKVIKFCIFIR